MKYIKRWLIRLIAVDISNGGETAKAIERQVARQAVSGEPVNETARFEDAVMKAIAAGQRHGRL